MKPPYLSPETVFFQSCSNQELFFRLHKKEEGGTDNSISFSFVVILGTNESYNIIDKVSLSFFFFNKVGSAR